MKTGIVVLGAPNEADGSLSVIAKSRCDKAFEVYLNNPDSYILCTGGYGSFNLSAHPHGYLTQRYLMSLGVAEKVFLDNAPSRFTLEDATLAKPILEAAGIQKLILVSSEFHIERVGYVFKHVFPSMILQTVSAITPISEAELVKLYAHEQSAMLREEENINQLKSREL